VLVQYQVAEEFILRNSTQKQLSNCCIFHAAIDLLTGHHFFVTLPKKARAASRGRKNPTEKTRRLAASGGPVKIASKECFNGSQTLYFLMEAALGGELYATYNRKGLHGFLG